jgi:protein-disulfide isomerase
MDRPSRRPIGAAGSGRSDPSIPAAPLEIAGSALIGSPDAKVVVIEYSDFQCPFCMKFFDQTLPLIAKKYINTGKIALVFRHLPLDSIHPFAQKAAEASECAGKEGKFWPMHDALFAAPKNLALPALLGRARNLTLSSSFDECLTGGTMSAKVLADAKSAVELGITGTPAFLIGTRDETGRVTITHRLSGAKPMGDFERIIDELLK